MAKRTTKPSPSSQAEVGDGRDLLELIRSDINGKGATSSYFLSEGESTPTDLSGWISTGSSILDLAISNRANGGFPVGRIVELMGLEGSGKSLICAHLCADIQKKGGVAVYIDTETALAEDFMKAVGVDLSKTLVINDNVLEDIFFKIEEIIKRRAEKKSDKPMLIIVDSVAAATTKIEMEADYGKDGWSTSKAIILSKAMRKMTQLIGREKILMVFTNQVRTKLGVTFGDAYTTSGGLAIGFHASCRIMLKKLTQIKTKDGDVIGVDTQAKVVKNRFGPPGRVVKFSIFFDRGIDDAGTWLEKLLEYGLVKQSGAWYTLDDGAHEPIKFQRSNMEERIFQDPVLKNHIYELIADQFVMRYKTDSAELTEDDMIREPVSDSGEVTE